MAQKTEGGIALRFLDEVDLFHTRVRDYAIRMTEQDVMRRTIPVEEYVREIGAFAIEFFDFIDSIDHLTSLESSGTDSVQNFAQEGRKLARKFVADDSVNPSY